LSASEEWRSMRWGRELAKEKAENEKVSDKELRGKYSIYGKWVCVLSYVFQYRKQQQQKMGISYDNDFALKERMKEYKRWDA